MLQLFFMFPVASDFVKAVELGQRGINVRVNIRTACPRVSLRHAASRVHCTFAMGLSARIAWLSIARANQQQQSSFVATGAFVYRVPARRWLERGQPREIKQGGTTAWESDRCFFFSLFSSPGRGDYLRPLIGDPTRGSPRCTGSIFVADVSIYFREAKCKRISCRRLSAVD